MKSPLFCLQIIGITVLSLILCGAVGLGVLWVAGATIRLIISLILS